MPNDRAKQFMPFQALNGYFELLEEAEIYITEKKELNKEEERELNEVFSIIRKGSIIEIIYYDKSGYRIRKGIVNSIQKENRKIVVVKEEIFFENIWKIKVLSK